ncbi:T9SS type A sorting domain-containing protein [Taibaiella lutea]|uniref:T9SS type A sorting domain-containing protein n=1 Tax=Taibaiella lutea TaxID=2608001 RepID=A0A5M6CNE7_9BACT|nr:T9SS type A sorting domain-containing protein [Taibaiella lutea]KAA5534669.1 T9SS type A sorting domain-containing protein [Taibaiella lutea]
MKQINLCFLLLITLLGIRANAQTNIDIGTGSSTSDNSPIQRNANYSASQLLYLSSEINNSGLISGLGFYKASGLSTVTIDSVYIYLKTTTDTSFGTSTTTASTNGYTLVYQGPYPNTVTGYSTVNFNVVPNFSYYTYMGNLAVLIVRPYQASTTSRPYYRYTTFAGSSRNAWYANSYAFSDTTTLAISNWRPNIRLRITATCPAPTSPTATNLTAFTADLNWTYANSPMTYEVKYGPQGFNVNTAGTSVYTATKPYTLNPPLTPSTSYSYYVRAICTVGDTSAWSAVTNFATPATCVAPSAPTSTGITKNSAILNWTNTGSPINFEIKYGVQGFDVNTAGTSVFTTTKPYILNPPLTPSTNYSYYVRSVCTPGDTSAWSPVKNFTTLCDYPSILSATDGTACSGGTATLQATADAGGSFKWYNVATGGTALGTGNSFVTPVLTTSDTFFAESSQLTTAGIAGVQNYSTTNGGFITVGTNIGMGIKFNALKNIIVDSIGMWVNDTIASQMILRLYSNTTTVVRTDTIQIAAFNHPDASNPISTANPYKLYIPLGYSLSQANNYVLAALPGSTTVFHRRGGSGNSLSYPYSNTAVSITANVVGGPSSTNTTQVYCIYDLATSTACTNPTRQPVIATVTPNPLALLPDTSGTCNGIAATLNSGSANTTWTPANVLYTDAAATTGYTGAALQTVYAKVTTPTTVYANTTSGACAFNDSVYIDLQTGTAVTITPATAAMACGDVTPVALTANTPVTWALNGGNLYTDAAGTTTYTGTATTGIYAKSNNNRNVIGAYEIGGCTFADTAVVIVNNPASSVTIANNSGAGNTDSSVVAGTMANLHNADCELMASVTPTGGAPLNGVLNGKIIMDGSVQNTATGPYVTRHFELTPANNAAAATANITLYFTQAEFTAYNTFVTNNGNPAVNPLLPTNPSDPTTNIRIDKFNAASGSPSPTNNNSVVVISPTSVTWDATNNWWAVTFPTTGFSGFFLHTNITATPLPIVWKNVSATLNRQKQAVINWTVVEKETAGYRVEKSMDGNKFENLAAINSKGTGNNAYSYTEPAALNGKAWYRIVQLSKEGKEDYSKIMELQNSSIYGRISIYPNPATQVLTVETETTAAYTIYDLQGKVVLKGNLQSGKNTLNISGLAKGFYTIKIGDYNQKIVLQ